MTPIYLIRHGRPASTWGGGDDDPGLDEVGRAQACAVAQRLLALPMDERPRAVVSSPLRRCRETAQPLAEALGVVIIVDPQVGEIPTPRRLSADQRPAWLRAAFAGAWAEIDGDLDYDAWRRDVTAAVKGHGGAAVFSHFVAINAVLSTLAGSDRVMGFRPDHTSVTSLGVDGDGLRIIERGGEASTGVL